MKQWPQPGDSPVVKARKVALAYRASAAAFQDQLTALLAIVAANPHVAAVVSPQLITVDAQTVQQLDERFARWGETWHYPRPTHFHDDDWVSAKVAAEITQLAPGTIHRLRVERRIIGSWSPDLGRTGGYLYRVGDLYQLSAKVRARRRKGDPETAGGAPQAATDNITDSGRSDGK